MKRVLAPRVGDDTQLAAEGRCRPVAVLFEGHVQPEAAGVAPRARNEVRRSKPGRVADNSTNASEEKWRRRESNGDDGLPVNN